MAPWRWFPCKPKHVGAASLILKCFNSSTFFNVVCISWTIKCWSSRKCINYLLSVNKWNNQLLETIFTNKCQLFYQWKDKMIIIIFLCGLFYCPVSVSILGWLVNDRLESIGKEAVTIYSAYNADVFVKSLRNTRRNSDGVTGVPAEILT